MSPGGRAETAGGVANIILIAMGVDPPTTPPPPAGARYGPGEVEPPLLYRDLATLRRRQGMAAPDEVGLADWAMQALPSSQAASSSR